VTTRKCQNCPARENPNSTILGVEREFASIERLEDTAKGIWSSFLGEKHALDCPISIVKQNFSMHNRVPHPQIITDRLSPFATPAPEEMLSGNRSIEESA